MAAPSLVYTIAYAAELLGETEAWLEELAYQLEPEDSLSGSTTPTTAPRSGSPSAASSL
jgi:hypothetical protein